MTPAFVSREALRDLLVAVDDSLSRSASVHLVGETSQLWEGWRPWTDCVRLTGRTSGTEPVAFEMALRDAASDRGLRVVQESPADVIPLPAGYEARSRPAGLVGECLQIFHFDPYSQCFRFLARGDEQD